MSIYIDVLIKVLISSICGLTIGYNREKRGKSAGIRTHAIVCVGSCLAIYISILFENSGSDAAIGRMAAGIIQGIGFLGAGMIITKPDKIIGLTSAASIWLTSIIGIICASKYYGIPVIAIVIYFCIEKISHLLEKTINYDNDSN